MAMSKKDFEEIAHRILVCVEDPDVRIDLANSLSEYFKTTNPNFNREKFWDAVVIDAGPSGPSARKRPEMVNYGGQMIPREAAEFDTRI